MIELQHVWVERQGRTILEDVDFEVARGAFVYLVGPTGSGKSTILRLLIFEEQPTRGVVFVGEYDSASLTESAIPYLRRRVGMVFQDFKLLRDRTVLENVALAMEVTGTHRQVVKRRTLSLLAEVDLIHKRGAYPSALSGGERQRVAIARALANEPFVLLADEPTANLDPEAADCVMGMLADVNARGTAVIMATHDTALVARHPRRVLRLMDGRLVTPPAGAVHREPTALSERVAGSGVPSGGAP